VRGSSIFVGAAAPRCCGYSNAPSKKDGTIEYSAVVCYLSESFNSPRPYPYP